jgi:YVTN family beta-propeller protein
MFWIVLSAILAVSTPSVKIQASRVFVTNERDGTITVIDADRDSVLGSFLVGGRCRGIRVSPDGKTLFVAVSKPSALPASRAKEYDYVVSVDVASQRVTRLYQAGSDPEQIDVTKDGKQFIAANEDQGTASFIDVKTGSRTAELIVGLEPEGVKISPDGRYAYVTSEAGNTVSVLDVKSEKVLKSMLVGSRPRDIAFCSRHHKAFTTNEHSASLTVIDTKKQAVTSEIKMPQGALPMCAVFDQEADRLYVSNGRGNSVTVLDCASEHVLATIPTGARTWGIALNSEGSKLYAANSLANTVSVIDCKTQRVIKTLKVGDGPWGVAFIH